MIYLSQTFNNNLNTENRCTNPKHGLSLFFFFSLHSFFQSDFDSINRMFKSELQKITSAYSAKLFALEIETGICSWIFSMEPFVGIET